MAVIFLAFWLLPSVRENMTETAEARAIVQETLPQLPTYAALITNKSRYGVRLWVLVVVGTLLVLVLGFTNVPLPVAMFILVTAMILAVVSPPFLRMRQASDQQERSYFKRLVFFAIIRAVLLIVSFGVVMVLVSPFMVGLAQQPVFGVLLFMFITFVLGLGLFYVIQLLPTLTVYHRMLAHGDYDRAVAQVDKYLTWLPHSSSFLFLRGFIELLGARYDAAEKTWYETLTEVQNGSSLIIGASLLNLGCALDGLKRHEEALMLFMAAIRARPQYGNGYQGLVSHYNDLDVEPERTLEVSRIALRYAHKPRTSLLMGLYNWSQLLGEHALALARMQQYDEADATMARAFKETDRHFQPGVAMLHTMAGRIALLKNDLPAAHEAFNMAMQLDPNGEAGARARQLLAHG
jgi:hypothetical protein